jgi:transposase
MAESENKESAQDIIEKARKQIAEEPNVSPALRTTVDLLINLVCLLAEKRIPSNSKNSSPPPSADPNREKKPKEKNGKKTGGQIGHKGSRLEPVENPDVIQFLPVDRSTLPPGNWKDDGYEKRQVFDIEIKVKVTEYQGERLQNEKGEKIVAEFPHGVEQATQYGSSVKSHVVYMSVYQLIPCDRVSEQFANEYKIPISSGSVCNFKETAYNALSSFETWVKKKLQKEKVINLDETGINVLGKRAWIHSASSELYTFYLADEKRGRNAMDKMEIIPNTNAVLVHDHWKPYYSYEGKTHALCNAHHGRELEKARESGQAWSKVMADFLLELNEQTTEAGGMLCEEDQKTARERYRKIVKDAEIECPPPPEKPEGKRGRVAKTKSRNLLDRLRDFEDDVLRFMTDVDVPFTNNLAERDLRMNKVHQKIPGCFRSIENANIFCRIRSYLSTCVKNEVSATYAPNLLFDGMLPGFIGLAE